MSEINPIDQAPVTDLERIIKGIETHYYQKKVDGLLVEGETDEEVERLTWLHQEIMYYYMPDVNNDAEAVFDYSVQKIKEAIKTKNDVLNPNPNN